MKLPASVLGNRLGWIVIAALAGAAAVLVALLGFVGLLLLGMATALVCARAEADEDNPLMWSRGSRAGFDLPRAEGGGERRSPPASLRLYFWCGVVLALLGAAGSVWQLSGA
jgi:hypothetical protein